MERLESLRMFVRTVRDGSFSAAGRHAGISATSVSRYITALEQSLGAKLLNRSSRTLSLTEAGQVFYHRVEPILADLQDAADAVSYTTAGLRGTLRVHAPITAGTLIIAPALPGFLEQFPELKIDLLLSNERAIDLVGDNIDVDIRVGMADETMLVARRLCESKPIICAAPSYLAAHAAPASPSDLAGHNCITFEHSLARAIWRFRDGTGTVNDVNVVGNLRTNNGVVIREALLRGLGLGLMPNWVVSSDIAANRLVRLLETYQATATDFGASVYAVYQQTRRGSPKIKAFVDRLAQLFAGAADG
jgi:DNA-binding transcriptional LysR family regulator